MKAGRAFFEDLAMLHAIVVVAELRVAASVRNSGIGVASQSVASAWIRLPVSHSLVRSVVSHPEFAPIRVSDVQPRPENV